MTRVKIKRYTYLTFISAVALSLPLSVWLTSLFTILAFLAWIADKGPFRIGEILRGKRKILLFLSIYFVYLVWMLNTTDLHSGLGELRLKLPLIVFPLITGLSAPLDDYELKILITSFITGVVLSSLIGISRSGQEIFSGMTDPRSLSPFVSHIRLALMAVFSVFCSAWLILKNPERNWWNFYLLITGSWLLVFLFILLSLTGLIVFGIVLLVSVFILALRSERMVPGFILLLLVIVPAGLLMLIVSHEIKLFYTPVNAYTLPPGKFTLNGNPYINELDRGDIENGNKVWIYICEQEMREQWNRKSRINYDSLDSKGQELKFTLIRYLTSAGLKKDSAGVSELGLADIRNIENGISNISFREWGPLKRKIYETVWQIDYYMKGGNPSRHSITQRIEFLKTGWHIFTRSPLFGIGTGDISKAYSEEYARENSRLEPAFRLLSHNQFLNFLISFGIAGTSIICFSLFFTFFDTGAHRHYLALVFFLIIIISMLGEDTWQTQTGITFFALFYSILIFGRVNNEKVDPADNYPRNPKSLL